jgi:hypothetical protein
LTDAQLADALRTQGMSDSEISEFIDLPPSVQNALYNNPNATPADLIAARRKHLANMSDEEYEAFLRSQNLPEDDIEFIKDVNPNLRDSALRQAEARQRNYPENNATPAGEPSLDEPYELISDEEYANYLRRLGHTEAEVQEIVNKPSQPDPFAGEDDVATQVSSAEAMGDLNNAVIDMDANNMGTPPIIDPSTGLVIDILPNKHLTPYDALLSQMQQ